MARFLFGLPVPLDDTDEPARDQQQQRISQRIDQLETFAGGSGTLTAAQLSDGLRIVAGVVAALGRLMIGRLT